MIHADCPPGVVARKLDATVQNLRHVLEEYREELNHASAAFDTWEARWSERQREIDAQLKWIETRLAGRSAAPSLSLVCGDE